jgi:hypothetical protein
MTYAFSFLTNGIALALTVVIFAQILALGGVTSPLREWLAVLLPGGTWLLPYGLVSNNHGISGLLVAWLSYLLLTVEWRGMTDRRAAGIGLCLGLLTAFEIVPIVSFVPSTMIFLACRRDVTRRGWLLCGVTLAAPLLAHAVINVGITGDVIPAGFHHELFNYPGSAFTDASLSGDIKYGSWIELQRYAWTALFAGKGFFTFAPIALLGIGVGLFSWRWWQRARGTQLVLLGSILLSLGAALVTSNLYGGEAVGFRHGAYLMPACLTLLLPWLTPRDARRWQMHCVVTVAAASAVMMLVLACRNPWTEMTLSNAAIGTPREYMPIVARALRGDLLSP